MFAQLRKSAIVTGTPPTLLYPTLDCFLVLGLKTLDVSLWQTIRWEWTRRNFLLSS